MGTPRSTLLLWSRKAMSVPNSFESLWRLLRSRSPQGIHSANTKNLLCVTHYARCWRRKIQWTANKIRGLRAQDVTIYMIQYQSSPVKLEYTVSETFSSFLQVISFCPISKLIHTLQSEAPSTYEAAARCVSGCSGRECTAHSSRVLRAAPGPQAPGLTEIWPPA